MRRKLCVWQAIGLGLLVVFAQAIGKAQDEYYDEYAESSDGEYANEYDEGEYNGYDEENYGENGEYDEDEDYEEGEENYDGEEEEEAEYEDSTPSEEEEEEVPLSSVVPEMLSVPLSITVHVGDRLELPCSAKDSSDLVRIWMFGESDMLFTGGVRTSRSPRFSLKQDEPTTLVVDPVAEGDDGRFTCRIMVSDEINLSHQVHVVDAFTVLPVPESGLISVNEYEAVILRCATHGGDQSESEASFKWRREGGVFTASGEYTFEGPEYEIENVTRADAGRYFCTAVSSQGESKTASLHVSVDFAPSVVSSGVSVRRGGNGLLMELVCHVTGQPQPKVTWYRGEEVIHLDEHTRQEKAGSRDVIIFKRVKNDDVGRYMCYVTNAHGAAQAVIQVGLDDLQVSAGNGKAATDSDLKEAQLDIEAMADREIEELRRRAEVELVALRNATARLRATAATQGEGRDRSSLDASVFADLERLQLELSRMQDNYNSEVGQLLEFRRKTKDDLQRVWDQVNELQETANVTSRQIEDIYDKDILRLQDFRSSTENELRKLSGEVAALKDVVDGDNFPLVTYSGDAGGDGVEKRTAALEAEVKLLRAEVTAARESDTAVRQELQGVYGDVDELKAARREAERDILMVERAVAEVEEGAMAEIRSRVDHMEDRKQTDEKMEKVSTYDEDKFNLLVQELQKVKSQIFYMQQSFLQMRGGGDGLFAESGADNETSSSSEAADEQIGGGGKSTAVAKMESAANAKELLDLRKDLEAIKSVCAQKSTLQQFISEVEDKETVILDALGGAGTRLDELEGAMHESSLKSEDTRSKLEDVAGRLDVMEAASKKYNLIISGMAPERKLERPPHVEQLVTKFFQTILRLEDVPFDEAERASAESSSTAVPPIVVRFPNVREKTRVLQASRDRTVVPVLREAGIFIREDFTEKVATARKRLAAFARRRAKRTRSKWALRYDELFFNGKVFVFDEKKNRVVPKPTIESRA